MAQEKKQKVKLLVLEDLLRRQTDFHHPMTTSALLAALSARGISCDRRTLADDILVMNEEGFEVMSTRVGHEKAYYIEERSFSLPELRILIDAVHSAEFITEAKTEELTEKLAALGGGSREALRSGAVRYPKKLKHTNEAVYYNVSALDDAIRDGHLVRFRYFHRDGAGGRIYRRNGGLYILDPTALLFNSGNYYLIAYNRLRGKLCTYRVDRMDRVEELPEEVCEEARVGEEELEAFRAETFHMFDGPETSVTLEFYDELLDSFCDRFGESVPITRTGDRCTATVSVRLSPTFYGWLFQFTGSMRVLAPEEAVEEYAERARWIARLVP